MSCVMSIGPSVLSFALARDLRTDLPVSPTPWLKRPDRRLDPSGCRAGLYAWVVDLALSTKRSTAARRLVPFQPADRSLSQTRRSTKGIADGSAARSVTAGGNKPRRSAFSCALRRGDPVKDGLEGPTRGDAVGIT